MSEAEEILASARAVADRRAAARVPINYTRAKAEFRQQKAALTRAVNSGDSDKVVLACKKAVAHWNAPDMAWPDDWSRWQIALDDALGWPNSVRLDDL
jgi:hypothetical protein